MMKYQWLRPQDFELKENLHNRIQHILANFQTQEFELIKSLRSLLAELE
jgi:hypothetical protein